MRPWSTNVGRARAAGRCSTLDAVVTSTSGGAADPRRRPTLTCVGDVDVGTSPVARRLPTLTPASGSPPHPAGVDVHPAGSVRAYVTATTRRAPAARSAAAHASSVAPVVWTSSTRSTDDGAGARAATTSRSPARRSSRPARVWRPATSCRREHGRARQPRAARPAPPRSAPPGRSRAPVFAAAAAARARPRPRRSGGEDRRELRRHQPRRRQRAAELQRPDERPRAALVRHRRMRAVERGARRRAAAAAMPRQRAARAAPPAQPRQRRARQRGAEQLARPAAAAPGSPGTAGGATSASSSARTGMAARTLARIACRISTRSSRIVCRTIAPGCAGAPP